MTSKKIILVIPLRLMFSFFNYVLKYFHSESCFMPTLHSFLHNLPQSSLHFLWGVVIAWPFSTKKHVPTYLSIAFLPSHSLKPVVFVRFVSFCDVFVDCFEIGIISKSNSSKKLCLRDDEIFQWMVVGNYAGKSVGMTF